MSGVGAAWDGLGAVPSTSLTAARSVPAMLTALHPSPSQHGQRGERARRAKGVLLTRGPRPGKEPQFLFFHSPLFFWLIKISKKCLPEMSLKDGNRCDARPPTAPLLHLVKPCADVSFLLSPLSEEQEKTQTRGTFTRRYHQEFISPGAAGSARASAAAGRRGKGRGANENKH